MGIYEQLAIISIGTFVGPRQTRGAALQQLWATLHDQLADCADH